MTLSIFLKEFFSARVATSVLRSDTFATECNTVLMALMNPTAGPQPKIVPSAVITRHTVSPKVGCVMAAPTALMKRMNKVVVRTA